MTECRFGWRGYEGERFCHEHRGFLEAGAPGLQCDNAKPGETGCHATGCMR